MPGRDEPGRDHLDEVHLTGDERRRHDGGDVAGVGELRAVGEYRRTTRPPRCRGSGSRTGAFLPTDHTVTSAPFAWCSATRRSVVRSTPELYEPARPAVTDDGEDADVADRLGRAEQLRRRLRVGGGGHDAGHAPCLRGRDGSAAMRAWARTIREAAMSSIALVIFLVDCTLRMRRRRMRSWPPAMDQSTFPVSNVSRNADSALSISPSSGRAPRRADVVEHAMRGSP